MSGHQHLKHSERKMSELVARGCNILMTVDGLVLSIYYIYIYIPGVHTREFYLLHIYTYIL